MPRVKPAVITLRDGTILRENTDKIEYGPQLISTYTVELQTTPIEKPKRGFEKLYRWNKSTIIKETKQIKVPIMSWPYSAIKSIDWGYMHKDQYDKVMNELAKAKQAADAKKQEKSNEHGMGNNKGTTDGAK